MKDGEGVVVVGAVHLLGKGDLLGIAQASGSLGGFFGLGEDGEEDGGEDRDDRDNDEEFDKRKCSFHIFNLNCRN